MGFWCTCEVSVYKYNIPRRHALLTPHLGCTTDRLLSYFHESWELDEMIYCLVWKLTNLCKRVNLKAYQRPISHSFPHIAMGV